MASFGNTHCCDIFKTLLRGKCCSHFRGRSRGPTRPHRRRLVRQEAVGEVRLGLASDIVWFVIAQEVAAGGSQSQRPVGLLD